MRVTPDLSVEVRSPSETPSRLQEKLDDYRAVGIPLIWIVEPKDRTVTIIARDADVRTLRAGDMLDGGAVLAGFSCPVAELFVGLTGSA